MSPRACRCRSSIQGNLRPIIHQAESGACQSHQSLFETTFASIVKAFTYRSSEFLHTTTCSLASLICRLLHQ